MNPPRDILLIWDIDGTLVCMDRAGERTWLVAVEKLYRRDLGLHLPIDMRGRTDTSVVRDVLAYLGAPVTPEEQERLQAAYLSLLPQILPTLQPYVHPGIREALATFHAHPSIHQTLLTGNLKEGARLKLRHLDLWNYFEFGAFADDSDVRDDLGPIVLARAESHLEIKFQSQNVYVIGDTPHDIQCGKAIGAQTIAVATGAFSFEELAALNPTFTFRDLTATEALLKIMV